VKKQQTENNKELGYINCYRTISVTFIALYVRNLLRYCSELLLDNIGLNV